MDHLSTAARWFFFSIPYPLENSAPPPSLLLSVDRSKFSVLQSAAAEFLIFMLVIFQAFCRNKETLAGRTSCERILNFLCFGGRREKGGRKEISEKVKPNGKHVANSQVENISRYLVFIFFGVSVMRVFGSFVQSFNL